MISTTQNEVARKVEERIEAARELLKPSPVDLHKVPNWLRRRMLAAFGCHYGNTSGSAVLHHAMRQLAEDHWLDHWGATTWGNHPAFVAEPYQLWTRDLQSIEQFADRCGIAWHVTPNSWWYPGWTLRVLFYERNDSQGGAPA